MMLALVALRYLLGEIPVDDGLGFDGSDYARGLTQGVAADQPNIALRPLVMWLNKPAYLVTGDVIDTFRVMNVVYAGLLAFALCSLFDRYCTSRTGKILLIANLSLCISTLQMPAYYPMLVDLGAMTVTTLAVLAIVREQRAAAVVLVALAVLAREFAAVCILFGLARDLRTRVRPAKAIATYAAAAVVLAALRFYVARNFTRPPLSAAQLLGNLSLWLDPVFAAVFVYFLLTLFGGVSLFIASSWDRVGGLWRREWEWPVFAVPIVAASALGDLDIWRYLVYVLPAAAVAFAVSWRGQRRGPLVVGTLVTLATVLTQRPFVRMSLDAYFVDWFPLYVHANKAPLGRPASMWPAWTWHFATAAVCFVVLVVVKKRRDGGQTPSGVTP